MKYYLHVLGGQRRLVSRHRYLRARANWKHAETVRTDNECTLKELRVSGHSALLCESALSSDQRDEIREAKVFKRKRRNPDKLRQVAKLGRNIKPHSHTGRLAHMGKTEVTPNAGLKFERPKSK